MRVKKEMTEVVREFYSEFPDDVRHLSKDKDWLWLKGIDLSGNENKAKREKLKELGWWWSNKRKAWYHPCNTAMIQRGRNKKSTTSKPVTDKPREPDTTTSSDVKSEFERMFG